jgi:hypothetical protein
MAGFQEQLQEAARAHAAASALESVVRAQIAEAFNLWDAEIYNAQTVRYRLERIVRSAYRGSAAVAAQHAVREAGIPGWTPAEIFNTDYLQSLLEDVRRNLRDYKVSDRGEVARRRAILRMQHSAGVAAQRGYTDQMISAYGELEGFGFRVRKVWLANLVNNTPCEHCLALHGTEVGLHESFPLKENKLKVYGDLLGPPRHPRCRCYLAILTVSLENALEALDIERPGQPAEFMTTSEVKSMPAKLFRAVVATLQRVVAFVRGGSRG